VAIINYGSQVNGQSLILATTGQYLRQRRKPSDEIVGELLANRYQKHDLLAVFCSPALKIASISQEPTLVCNSSDMNSSQS
jgi:hypothetical protein